MTRSTSKPNETILIVDDDAQIRCILQTHLEQEHFRPVLAQDGQTALHLLHEVHPSLMLLDLILPDCSGWDIARSVRNDGVLKHIPIIMLTGRGEASDKLKGFALGADDYITKPFNLHEVVARIRAVLRRTACIVSANDSVILEYAAIRMNVAQHEVTVDGQGIALSPTEFQVLKTLLQKREHVLSRATLLDLSFGYEYDGQERTLDSHIKNLRKKLESNVNQPTYIQTVYGVGYMLKAEQRQPAE